MVKYYTLLLLICFARPAFADEVLSENAAGIPLYSVEEPSAEKTSSSWQDKAQEVMIHALSLTGVKYKYGGGSPATGFDCSGFVRYVFRNAANLTLPPTARAIAQEAEVELAFTADAPTQAGKNFRVPMPGRLLPPEQVAEARGFADSFALKLKHHNEQPFDGHFHRFFHSHDSR